MSDEEDHVAANESIQIDMTSLIKDVWAPVKEVGKGQFGKVYHVLNIKDGREAAMKIEKVTQESVLKIEKEVMQLMRGQIAALQIYDDGVDANNNRFLIMTLCGFDLTKVAEMLNNKFSDSTILRIATRTLFAIKTLHEVGYVHRDLKPCNMAVDSRNNSHVIYLLDFGMSRRFARFDNKEWIIRSPRSQCRFRGTMRYCSINMHKRIELGRVDDLWSWFYMVIEMRVELPWSGTTHPDKVEIQKVELIESTINKDPLIKALHPIFDHLNKLTYPDRPDYLMLYTLLMGKLEEIGGKLTDPIDFDAIRPPVSTAVKDICKKYNVQLQTAEKSLNEERAIDTLSKGFAVTPMDVPGGEKYVISKGKNFYKSNNSNNNKKDCEPVSLARKSSRSSLESRKKQEACKSKKLTPVNPLRLATPTLPPMNRPPGSTSNRKSFK